MKSRIAKAFFGVAAGFSLFVGATPAHAAQLSSSQVQAVIQLLQSFGADQATLATVSNALGAPYYPTPVPPSSSCPALSYNLYQGVSDSSTGGQVSQLQRYFGLVPTGYFGPLTKQAVANFQQQYAVYPVTGGVGPLTRAAIARACGGLPPTPTPTPTPTPASTFSFNSPFAVTVGQTLTEYSLGQLTVQLMMVGAHSAEITLGENCQRGTQCFYYPTKRVVLLLNQPTTFEGYTVTLQSVSYNSAVFVATKSAGTENYVFSATPTSGAAPLQVTFSGTANAGCGGGNFELAYGDGQVDFVAIPADACTYRFNKSHTYANPGTYTATLSNYIACFYTTPRCLMAQPAPISAVTISVTGSRTSSISLTQPTYGQVVTRGKALPVTWTTTGVPSDASVILDLYTEAGVNLGPIAIPRSDARSYLWTIPAYPASQVCTMQYPNGLCGVSIPAGKYYIRATATSDAFGPTNASALYGTSQSGTFTIY